jgi:dTDP-4-amino-4,6-dideoxygalactose transaminase
MPWLFDVDAASWCLDLDQLEATLARETHQVGGTTFHTATGMRVSALMPVCAVGLVPDLRRFRAIADQYGVPLVVDAAAAIGGTRDGQPWGRAADLAVISFNGNKTVTSGGGGAVVGGNERLLARVRHLSSTARVDADYNHDAVAFNYRMTNICAAVGCAQMEQLGDFVAAKRRIRDAYRDGLSDVASMGFYPEANSRENVCWLSGAVLPEQGPAVSAVVAALKAEEIEARAFWKPIHLQTPYLHARRTSMTVTDALWRRVITLPSSTSLTVADQHRVIAAVRRALA